MDTSIIHYSESIVASLPWKHSFPEFNLRTRHAQVEAGYEGRNSYETNANYAAGCLHRHKPEDIAKRMKHLLENPLHWILIVTKIVPYDRGLSHYCAILPARRSLVEICNMQISCRITSLTGDGIQTK
jgi:hypothetical protein